MSKNRERQRINKKLAKSGLGRKNEFGKTDLTPYNAFRFRGNVHNIVCR